MSTPGTRPDLALKILAGWITYLSVFSWLPFLRAVFDGATYQWGTSHFGVTFHGAGVGPDLWLPAIKWVLMVALLWLALRRRGPIFRGLLALWSVTLAVDAAHAAITNPGSLEFHGDTLGIHLDLGPPVVIIFALAALLAIYWSFRNRKAAPIRVAWLPSNAKLLALWVALLPIQFLLLRFGEPHGTTDAIGVLITIAQCPLLAWAFYPRSSKTT